MTEAQLLNEILLILHNDYLTTQKKNTFLMRNVLVRILGGSFMIEYTPTKLKFLGDTLNKFWFADYNFNNDKHEIKIAEKGVQLFEQHYDFLDFLKGELSRQYSEFHQRQKQYPNKPELIKIKTSNIFQKIYNLSNHQVIGGLILAGLLSIIGWYLKTHFHIQF